jgi:NagD protein
MLAALEACTGARAEAVVGKPSRYMAEAFLARLGLGPAGVAVVGDRLATDVAMGRSIGAAAILVLTGATSSEVAAGGSVAPDFVLDGLQQLLAADRTGAPT